MSLHVRRSPYINNKKEKIGYTISKPIPHPFFFINLPDAFQMHGSYFNYDSSLFILENPIPLATRHTSNVQELGTIDHIIIY